MATYGTYNLDHIRNPELRLIIQTFMDISTGHDHDGTNTKAVANSGVAADYITNAMVKSDAAIVATKFSTAVQASLALADSALQSGEALSSATPVNAVASQGTYTQSGVGLDGDYLTINGVDIYELCADVAQSLANGTIAVDITSYTTASAGELTIDTQPTAYDNMVIGNKTYTFVAPAEADDDGLISIGTDLATAQAAIIAAINGTDSVNTAHTQVSAGAFATNASVITALVGGVAGDSIATTETFTAGTNVFDAATLGTEVAGVDCTAANAVTAIVAAITASDTQGVGAADGAGDTVTLTADTKGTVGDAITTTENMTNGTMDAATLGTTTAGVDGTVGAVRAKYSDDNYLYIAIAANTIADANWRRISLGSAY